MGGEEPGLGRNLGKVKPWEGQETTGVELERKRPREEAFPEEGAEGGFPGGRVRGDGTRSPGRGDAQVAAGPGGNSTGDERRPAAAQDRARGTCEH